VAVNSMLNVSSPANI